MPEYLSPGVYVEEVSSGIKPIEGVGTSTGAFIGIAQRGPIGKPRLITNWTQFTATFGGFVDNGYLAYAVYQFFSEGGTRCYVIRAAKGSATALKKAETAAIGSLIVRANSEGTWGNALSAVVADETALPGGSVRVDYFKLSVVYQGTVVEAFDNVTLDETRPDHVLKRVDSKWVEVVDSGATRPGNGTTPLAGGLDGDTLLTSDWAGATGFINAFDPVDDINIVAIPDALGDATVESDIVYGTGIPAALSLLDIFHTMDEGFRSERVATPGLININTAPVRRADGNGDGLVGNVSVHASAKVDGNQFAGAEQFFRRPAMGHGAPFSRGNDEIKGPALGAAVSQLRRPLRVACGNTESDG